MQSLDRESAQQHVYGCQWLESVSLTMKDFKLMNTYKVDDAENDIKNREHACVNLNSIANICNCTVDQVN